MNAIDLLTSGVQERLVTAPRSRQSAFFAACAIGLRPAMLEWQAGFGGCGQDVFDRAVETVELLLAGDTRADAVKALGEVESCVPPGESRGAQSTTSAQDCWICLDTALRIWADTSFDPVPVIEYAIQPIAEAASERLFGFSDVGSEAEDDAVVRLVADHQVKRAVEFLVRLAESVSTVPAVSLTSLSIGSSAILP